MIFFLVMPGLFGGFGNYFVPIFQGSPEVVYPRVNNFSILILLLSYLFLILSLISEFGGGTGWTLYPPLSTSFMTLSPSSTGNLIFGLIISGISSCLTSLNFWTTIHFLRSYYLILSSIPLFPWAFLITAFMLLLTLPILSGTLLLILGDLHSNTLFFDPIFGGDPIFYQHFFWFFGHPEVYILIIPAFGIISIIISGILQLIIFANQSMIFAMSSISLLGGLVWGHHMYTVGLESDTRAYFTGVTILISLPTGTKIFNWLFTYLSNPPLLHLRITSVFLSHLFLLMFTIGGSTGIILGNGAVDLGLHDTYYVVAHFHFVLSLGAIIAIFSGIILNGEKIVATKNLLLSSSCTLSLYHLHLIFIGILLTFSPMHFLGFNVMPRRIPSFPDSFHSWNSLSSIGSGITFLSFGPSVGGSVRIPSHMFPVHPLLTPVGSLRFTSFLPSLVALFVRLSLRNGRRWTVWTDLRDVREAGRSLTSRSRFLSLVPFRPEGGMGERNVKRSLRSLLPAGRMTWDRRVRHGSEVHRESLWPASQSPPVATVCLRHPVTTVDDWKAWKWLWGGGNGRSLVSHVSPLVRHSSLNPFPFLPLTSLSSVVASLRHLPPRFARLTERMKEVMWDERERDTPLVTLPYGLASCGGSLSSPHHPSLTSFIAPFHCSLHSFMMGDVNVAWWRRSVSERPSLITSFRRIFLTVVASASSHSVHRDRREPRRVEHSETRRDVTGGHGERK